jgi:uncharacterized RDD family membrane protein YckC
MTENKRADSLLGVQTPEGIEYVLYPAGILIRACAWGIDSLIQGVLLLTIVIASSILASVMGIWFLLILIFALDWFYHTAFEVLCRGQSPGKRLMGVRVVRGDGSPVNPGASFLRNLLRFADTFLFLYLIALISMLVSPGFRRLGDWVADTLVVYTANARSPGRFSSPVLRRSTMPWLADVPMVSPSRKLEYEETQAILMFARRYPLLGRARADEIARIWTAKLEAREAEASACLLGIAHTVSGTQIPGSTDIPAGNKPA